MSNKNEQLTKLLKRITPRAALPKTPEGLTLLEQGLLCVLARHVPQERAETFVVALRKAYPEWNEMRVAQTDEIAALKVQRGGSARELAVLGQMLMLTQRISRSAEDTGSRASMGRASQS